MIKIKVTCVIYVRIGCMLLLIFSLAKYEMLCSVLFRPTWCFDNITTSLFRLPNMYCLTVFLQDDEHVLWSLMRVAVTLSKTRFGLFMILNNNNTREQRGILKLHIHNVYSPIFSLGIINVLIVVYITIALRKSIICAKDLAIINVTCFLRIVKWVFF